MELDQFKEKMEFYLKKDKLGHAFQLLESFTSERDLYKEVLLQHGKYEHLQKQIRDGVLSGELSNIELNKIRIALKEIVDNLFEDIQFEKAHKDDQEKKRSKEWKLQKIKMILVFVPLAALGVIGLYLLSSNNWQTPENKKKKIVIMDSPLKDVVYDFEGWKKGQTNADEITEILDDFDNVEIVIEKTSLTWSREEYIYNIKPDLIIIHISCFYEQTNPWDSDRKFYSFLEYISKLETKWIIYSRGFHHEKSWQDRLVGDLPDLKNKVALLTVDSSRTFKDVVIRRELKSKVKSFLNI